MTNSIEFRKANLQDIDFIIETIFAAEKSGTDRLSYSTIFGIQESELLKLFQEMLAEDIDGQELSISTFMIAEIDQQYAGACSAWVEGIYGDSSILKANLLSYYLPPEKLILENALKEALSEMHLARTKNTIQIESVYVRNNFRGKGIVQQIIEKQIQYLKQEFNFVNSAEIIVAMNNESALKAYQKMGFEICKESSTHFEKILSFLPSNKRVILQKILS